MDDSKDKMLPLQHPKDGKQSGRYRAHVIKPQHQAQLDERGSKFEAELRKILRVGDVFRFRNFLSKDGRSLPTDMMLDTLKMETLMHQLIMTLPDLADIHPRSQAWLDDNTHLKPRGLTLLQVSSLTPVQKKRLVTTENPDDVASN